MNPFGLLIAGLGGFLVFVGAKGAGLVTQRRSSSSSPSPTAANAQAYQTATASNSTVPGYKGTPFGPGTLVVTGPPTGRGQLAPTNNGYPVTKKGGLGPAQSQSFYPAG